jgi:hypothetical protein
MNFEITQNTPLMLRRVEKPDTARVLDATLFRTEGTPTNTSQSTTFESDGKSYPDYESDSDRD